MPVRSKAISRAEDGQVLAIVAVVSVVLLLFAALVIDVGNWFSHKRQLQNRADAGALAAGSEWATKFTACAQGGVPADTAGKAIARIGQQYAGNPNPDPDPPGTGYDPTLTPPVNTETANQSNVEVFINSTDEDSTVSDGGGPCFKHPPGDPTSPQGGYWTDVRVKERNLQSFFGSIGIPLTRNIARARVELRQVDTVTQGVLPFVGETADVAPCAWVQFVRDDGTGSSGNPVPGLPPTLLQGTGSRTYATAAGNNIVFTMPAYNISARITIGSLTNGACSFATTNKVSFAASPSSLGLAYLHSGYNGPARTPLQSPGARSITINPAGGACPDTYFVKKATACTVGVQAVIDFGDPGPGDNPVANLGASVTATMNGGAPVNLTYIGAGLWQNATSFTIAPNSGRNQFTVNWARTLGTITGTGNCNSTGGNPCKGNFGGFNQMVYSADDGSGPVATLKVLDSAGVTQPGFAPTGSSVSLKLQLALSSFDPAKLVIIRGSVQGTDNRTSAVDCGYGTGSNALRDAIEFGCPPVPGPPNGYQKNTRNDGGAPPQRTFSCTPFSLSVIWDCLSEQPVVGNRTGPVEQAMQVRFGCTPNNFPNPYIPGWIPAPGDPRISTIFLTSYGTLEGNGDFPIVDWVTVYVTGFNRKNNQQCASDAPRPPNATNQGTELWGHYISLVDISGNTQPGPSACDLSVQGLLCAPALVR